MQRWKKEQIYPLLKKWKKSNQSKRDFCSIHGIKVSTFYYWLSKLGSEQLDKKRQGEFISLELTNRTKRTTPASIEIHYPNGVRLVIQELRDLSVLPMLLQSHEACSI